MVHVFREENPGFRTFEDCGDRYREQEDTYKRLGAKVLHELFDDWVRGAEDSLSPKEFVGRHRQFWRTNLPGLPYAINLLGWRDVQMVFETLLGGQSRQAQFRRHLHALLRVAGTSQTIAVELDAMVGWMKDLGCPASLSKALPSALLFLWNPSRFFFIKPNITDGFLKDLGEQPLGQGRYLTAEVYDRLLATMGRLKQDLGELSPRDFIDVQGFVWVVMNSELEYPDLLGSEEAGAPPHAPSRSPSYAPIAKNLILYGPPGTGKTYTLANKYLPRFRDGDSTRADWVTFHQSYGYEDFVEGLRPRPIEVGGRAEITYDVFDGIFKQMVRRAMQDPEHDYALLIDEINRGNISKIFGELITLLEEDKRLRWNTDRKAWEGDYRVKLPYTHATHPEAELFGVPDNLYVIGAMNTADRSIALLDTALRRRFDFEELEPDSEVLKTAGVRSVSAPGGPIDVVTLFQAINDRIEILYDRDHRIGHSYFLGIKSFDDLAQVLVRRVIPLLQEYFNGDWEKVQLVFNDLDPSTMDDDMKPKGREDSLIRYSLKSLKGESGESDQLRRIYEVPKRSSDITAEAVRTIYDDWPTTDD